LTELLLEGLRTFKYSDSRREIIHPPRRLQCSDYDRWRGDKVVCECIVEIPLGEVSLESHFLLQIRLSEQRYVHLPGAQIRLERYQIPSRIYVRMMLAVILVAFEIMMPGCQRCARPDPTQYKGALRSTGS